ncbi:MAG: hypothetical protein ACYTGF_16890, partial [Planctomycetota bacterium]
MTPRHIHHLPPAVPAGSSTFSDMQVKISVSGCDAMVCLQDQRKSRTRSTVTERKSLSDKR